MLFHDFHCHIVFIYKDFSLFNTNHGYIYAVNPPTSTALPPSESHESEHNVPLTPMAAPAHPPNFHGTLPTFTFT